MRENDLLSLNSASARSKALETRLLTKENLYRLCDASDVSEISRLLSEAGYGGASEASLSEMLVNTYELFSELMKDHANARNVLLYKYDCHNIKSAVKCLFSERRVESLMVGIGTVSGATVAEYVKNRDFSLLPENMGKASEAAANAYAASPDPQVIDAVIDAACFADMLASAKKSQFDFPVTYTRMKIDLANIRIAFRAFALGLSAAKLESLLISGGSFDPSEVSAMDMTKFIASCRYSEYGGLIDSISEHPASAPSSIERLCEDYEAEFLRSYAYKDDKCADVYIYVLKREYEIKNVRSVLSAKRYGKDPQEIKEILLTGLL